MIIINLSNVVFSRDLKVCSLNAEVKRRETRVFAFELGCPIYDGVVNAFSCEELFHNTVEPNFRDHDVRCRNIENGVQTTFTIGPNALLSNRP